MNDMNDAVFISDLHLHPKQPEITAYFQQFIQWAATSTRRLYILGDFFHVWTGDDGIDQWHLDIAAQLSWLAQQGVSISFMHGNRDFLLGETFANAASMTLLQDPTVITLDNQRVLLTHGDQYCTHDRGHQWLRRLTRNRLFSFLFLNIPMALRAKCVSSVRTYSQHHRQKPSWRMAIVPSVMIAQMQRMKTEVVVHGHIHKPGLTTHVVHHKTYRQYVLSDWDVPPTILCYNTTKGFYFIPVTNHD